MVNSLVNNILYIMFVHNVLKESLLLTWSILFDYKFKDFTYIKQYVQEFIYTFTYIYVTCSAKCVLCSQMKIIW